MKKNHKFAVAGGIVLLTIGFLIYTALMQSTEYYMTVVELKDRGREMVGQGLRASGQVKDGTIRYDKEKLVLDFAIFDAGKPDQLVNVTYKGIQPDTFKADVEVIISGRYNPDENLFKATTLLVKCPSRYEGQTPPEGYKHDKPADNGKPDDKGGNI